MQYGHVASQRVQSGVWVVDIVDLPDVVDVVDVVEGYVIDIWKIIVDIMRRAASFQVARANPSSDCPTAN